MRARQARWRRLSSRCWTAKAAPRVGITRISEAPETSNKTDEPTQILTGKKNDDGSTELRVDSVARDKPNPGEPRGVVNIQKTKAKGRKMINTGKGGTIVQPRKQRNPRKTARERAEESGQLMLKLSGLEDYGSAIKNEPADEVWPERQPRHP